MTDRETQDQSLDALFDAARVAPPQVPKALMARVLHDAERQMPGRRGTVARVLRWGETLGGGLGIGGLVTATCVGFWIGLAPPGGLPDLGNALLGSTVYDTTELALADVYDGGWISGLEEALEDE